MTNSMLLVVSMLMLVGMLLLSAYSRSAVTQVVNACWMSSFCWPRPCACKVCCLRHLVDVLKQESCVGKSPLEWFGVRLRDQLCLTGDCAHTLYSPWRQRNGKKSIANVLAPLQLGPAKAIQRHSAILCVRRIWRKLFKAACPGVFTIYGRTAWKQRQLA